MTFRSLARPSIGRIKQIVEKSDTKAGRIFDLAVLGLIVSSLVAFSIETLPDLPPAVRSLLRSVELITVVAFTVEYLLRVSVADPRLGFV